MGEREKINLDKTFFRLLQKERKTQQEAEDIASTGNRSAHRRPTVVTGTGWAPSLHLTS